MKGKVESGIMLILLFVGMATLAFNIQPVKSDWTWTETIYIRADGSVDPDTAPISSADNITYTLTDNIVAGDPPPFTAITVERDNIVVDGAGYMVQRPGSMTGILLINRNNVTIKNVKATNFYDGICVQDSSNVTLANNTVSVCQNSGIRLLRSSNNVVTGNNASSNRYGILLDSSDSNVLTANTASLNFETGIVLGTSSNNTLAGNTALNNCYNFYVGGYVLSDFDNSVDTSNTVEGKPIYYLIGLADAVYDAETNAGTIYLINCDNVTIRDLNLTKNESGVFFWNTTNSKIENVTTSNSHNGIFLRESSNNTLAGNTAVANKHLGISLWNSSRNVVTGNNASNNMGGGISLVSSDGNVLTGNTVSNSQIYGIDLIDSRNNTVFHNSLIDNWVQASVRPESVNMWNSDYPSGGNYWSDYAGVDVKTGPNQDAPGSDGIGDTPYIINANNTDHYPLMYPLGSPPPPTYTLTVHSSPIAATFMVDNITRVAPWSGTYDENASVSLTMPETSNGYVWSHWLEDDDTNRTRAVEVNTNITLTAVFTDITPPTISVLSPENKTYSVEDVPLTFTVNETTSWIGYSLDSQANVTITGNTTLSELSDSSHSLVVYAADTAGNTGASEIIYFSVETPQPFPTLIVAAIVIVAVVGAVAFVYFTKFKK